MMNGRGSLTILISALVCFPVFVAGERVHATEQPEGMVEQPCPPPLTPSPAVRDLLVELFIEPRKLTAADFDRLMRNPQFIELNEANVRRAAQDWPGLCRYRAANASASTASTAPRVVFMGDSITENWALADPAFFERGLVNRGIGGQTTAQMLVRFRADVVALRPKVVHLLAGTNDIAGNTGPTTAQDFKNNIMSMAEIARTNGIDVILGSIPPAAAFSWRPKLNPAPRVKELNMWLRDYAAKHSFGFIDYHAPLAGASSELRTDLGNDGVHPNRQGYAIMRRLVEGKLAERRR
jgi:lysophospholipase L1-like esterase